MSTEIIEHEGWTFAIQEGEPLISDEVLAAHLEMSVYKVRRLIERHAKAGHITPVEVLPTVGKTGGRPGKRYLLTQEDALYLVTQSEAPKARAMTKVMIRVFVAVQLQLRGAPSASELPPSDPPPDPELELRYERIERLFSLWVTRELHWTRHTPEDGHTVTQILLWLLENVPRDLPMVALRTFVPFLLNKAAAARTRGEPFDERELLALFVAAVSTTAPEAVRKAYAEECEKDAEALNLREVAQPPAPAPTHH